MRYHDQGRDSTAKLAIGVCLDGPPLSKKLWGTKKCIMWKFGANSN